MIDILVVILMVIGAFFFFVGALGLWRFPDVYSRAHATTKCDTLGGGLIILALALRLGSVTDALKLIAIIILIWITNATAAHVIGRAAYNNRYPHVEGTYKWNYHGEEDR
ncbi:MAG: monovalent cation/H(+) antiporter subunit G [Firmicutes bacterium]|nr:monovalent cation/H(+) antiporter subunit G [Bacillota bacterium]